MTQKSIALVAMTAALAFANIGVATTGFADGYSKPKPIDWTSRTSGSKLSIPKMPANKVVRPLPSHKPMRVATTKSTPIPLSRITTLIRTAFSGTRIRLNNFGTVRAPFVENASSVRLGPLLGGRSQRFTIFPFFQPRKPVYYYLSDVNLRNISVGTSRQFIRISLHFEDSGTELKGICRGSRVECFAGRDGTVPDIQIRNIRVDVLLEPWATDGSVSYRRAFVRFHGDSQAGGICRVTHRLGADICRALYDYKTKITQETERAVRSLLNRADLRRHLATAMRPVLRAEGVGNVFFTQIRSGNLVVYHRRRLGS